MARRKVIQAQSLKSWADVDCALREIAENELALDDIEAEMNRQILGAKKVAEQECKPHADRIAKLAREISDFAEEHRSDFGTAKSKVLNFGEVGFRISTSIVLPKSKEKLDEIIRKLKARKMKDCLIVKETISKEKLKTYGKETALAVGAGWKQKDGFGYDVYKQKLERSSLAHQD